MGQSRDFDPGAHNIKSKRRSQPTLNINTLTDKTARVVTGLRREAGEKMARYVIHF